MGVTRGARLVAFLLAFLALFSGVMGDSVDTDLVGIVVAAVCVAILLIVLVSFLTFCCFRGVEFDRDSVAGRKNSGSLSTNNNSGPPRWTPNMAAAAGTSHSHQHQHPRGGGHGSGPSAVPVYSMATVTEPVLYALPSGTGYILGQHSRLRESDRMKYLRQEQHLRQTREQEPPHTQQQTAVSQPNGHVVKDLPPSAVSYRAVHAYQSREHLTPQWLMKSYVETEKSLDIHEEDDEEDNAGEGGKKTSSVPLGPPPATTQQPPLSSSPPQQHQPLQPQPQPQPQGPRVVLPRGARVQVSPKHSKLDSRDVLHVSEEFTIVDFLDPLQQGQGGQRQQQQLQRGDQPSYSYHAYLERDFSRTTAITKYSAPGPGSKRPLADISQSSSGIGYVPPVSTSTPRSPSSDPPRDRNLDRDPQPDNAEHPRMRKPKEGSVRILPAKGAGGYKGDFML